MNDTIKGMVEKQIFYNESNHYGVFLISLENNFDAPLTIVGNLFNLEVDSFYEFTGRYVENPRFGMQFEVMSFKPVSPKERDFVIRYLSGPSFPGIGLKSAEALVDKYGDDIIEVIRKDPELDLKVAGIRKDKLDNLKEIILSENPMDAMVTFLNTHGITGKSMSGILNKYQENTQTLIEENPYRMMEEVPGVGFSTCDKIAQALGFSADHPLRISALMNHTFKELCFNAGHSFISKHALMLGMPQFNVDLLEDAYQNLLTQRILIEDEERLYHQTQYDAEKYVSHFLKTRHANAHSLMVDDFDKQMNRIESKLHITFDAQQIEAIRMFLEEDVMILTGGPGTGKSTLLSGLVMFLQSNYPGSHVSLLAPTGRAAKRLEDLTNVSASTIHAALKWNPDTNEFGFNESNPLDTDILIVDEFSMVDLWVLSNLLLASGNVMKIMFVGDKDQLPSVGPGFVLKDLLESEMFPTMELEYNYRQIEGSEVIDLALKVNEGHFDVEGYHKDVKFFDTRQYPGVELTLKIVEEALQKGYSIFDIQVLAPVYRGSLGIDNLNYFLQKSFNPEDKMKRSIQFGSRIYREGDKILQLKNQPDDSVYNGDIGVLVEIDDRKNVIVDYDGNYVSYETSDLINITHAYCMSVHKAQGSEYPIVILMGDLNYRKMLSKRLYYTAITRSSKSLILIGQVAAFEKAAAFDEETKRNTYLKQRLQNI